MDSKHKGQINTLIIPFGQPVLNASNALLNWFSNLCVRYVLKDVEMLIEIA